jgi:nitrogen-specific signal transduction histidine kinase/CheY-like chemotaxis protein
MTVMAVLTNVFLVSFFASFVAGVYFLWVGFKRTPCRWLSVLYLLLATAALAHYFFSTATSIQQAGIAIRLSWSTFLLFPAAYLFFATFASNSAFSVKGYIMTGIPAAITLLIHAFNLNGHFSIATTGDAFTFRIAPMFLWVYSAVAAGYFILVAIFVLRWRNGQSLNREKSMANIFLLAIILSLFYIVFDTIAFDQPRAGILSNTLFLACGILTAVSTFGLIYFEKTEVPVVSEQLLLLSLTSDFVFFLDNDGNINKHNLSPAGNLGYPPDDIILKPMVDLIWHTEKAHFNSLMASKKPWECPFNCTTASNEKMPVFFRCSDLSDKYGDPAGCILTGQNQFTVKRLKQETALNRELQYELLKSKEKANESDKLKAAFLSIITHELRTPLNGILGFTELLKTDFEGSEHFEIIEHLDKSGKRLLGTINSIIDLSLIETNKSEINKQPVDLKDLVSEKTQPYIAYAQSKRLDFKIDFRDENLMARTDERMLGHVISNLLDNAVKYTEAGGITVSLQAVENKHRTKALIKVSDTGIGIDKKDFTKIFEKFRQGSEGYNRTYEGMGIGLSICKTIIEMLDGEIWVESESGKGSVFYLQIPAYFSDSRQAEDTEPEKDNTEAKTQQARPCALIVEENFSNRTFLKYLLLEAFEVDDAINGIRALEMAQKNQYDLIFFSLNPDTEAIETEAMKKIKKLPGYEKVPMAAVTTNLQKNEADDLFYRGFTHYIAKPYTRASVLETAGKMLKSAGSKNAG